MKTINQKISNQNKQIISLLFNINNLTQNHKLELSKYQGNIRLLQIILNIALFIIRI
jgi:hypothetical protein